MRRLVLLVAVFVAAFGIVPVMAQPSAAPAGKTLAIAIVDVPRVLQDSQAAKSVQQQIETQRSKFQAEITTEEADLRGAEQKLAKLRQSAQTDAYVEEEQKLRQRFMTVERHVQARRKALDQAFTDAMGKVREAIVSIVASIAKEKGVGLVVVKQQVIWNDQAIDLTEEVLARLNKTLPGLDVKVTPEDEGQENKPLILKPSLTKSGKK